MGEAVLASWNEGKAKEAVLGFVERATTDGPDFVQPVLYSPRSGLPRHLLGGHEDPAHRLQVTG